jgi:hypothetical protein
VGLLGQLLVDLGDLRLAGGRRDVVGGPEHGVGGVPRPGRELLRQQVLSQLRLGVASTELVFELALDVAEKTLRTTNATSQDTSTSRRWS